MSESIGVVASGGRGLRIDWILTGTLAIGRAPRQEEDLEELQAAGIRTVLSLCAPAEAPPPAEIRSHFSCHRYVLKDHRGAEPTRAEELVEALDLLGELIEVGAPVYVHCVASVERSPLVAMGWLMRTRGMGAMQALEYLMSVHPGASPLGSQLALLQQVVDGPG